MFAPREILGADAAVDIPVRVVDAVVVDQVDAKAATAGTGGDTHGVDRATSTDPADRGAAEPGRIRSEIARIYTGNRFGEGDAEGHFRGIGGIAAGGVAQNGDHDRRTGIAQPAEVRLADGVLHKMDIALFAEVNGVEFVVAGEGLPRAEVVAVAVGKVGVVLRGAIGQASGDIRRDDQ